MPFNVAVIGTGIAGLGAAIALTAKGHAVTILEATTELRPIGGIIVLQANANRVLDGLGAYEQLKPFRCHIPHGPSTRDYKGGEYLCRVPADTHEKDYGYPYVMSLLVDRHIEYCLPVHPTDCWPCIGLTCNKFCTTLL